MKIDTPCLVAFDQPSDTTSLASAASRPSPFGGERLFFAALTGPGRVWLQTLPFSRLADRIHAACRGDVKRDLGGMLGGLGDLIAGDRSVLR